MKILVPKANVLMTVQTVLDALNVSRNLLQKKHKPLERFYLSVVIQQWMLFVDLLLMMVYLHVDIVTTFSIALLNLVVFAVVLIDNTVV